MGGTGRPFLRLRAGRVRIARTRSSGSRALGTNVTRSRARIASCSPLLLSSSVSTCSSLWIFLMGSGRRSRPLWGTTLVIISLRLPLGEGQLARSPSPDARRGSAYALAGLRPSNGGRGGNAFFSRPETACPAHGHQRAFARLNARLKAVRTAGASRLPFGLAPSCRRVGWRAGCCPAFVVQRPKLARRRVCGKKVVLASASRAAVATRRAHRAALSRDMCASDGLRSSLGRKPPTAACGGSTRA